MIDKSVSQMDITSGRHKYAGDPVNLKLRLVFTDATLITEKPFAPNPPQRGCSSERDNATHKYQEQSEASKQDDQVQHDERHQACYILAKQDDNYGWSITEEKNLTGRVRNSIKATPTQSCKDSDPDVSLAALIKHRGLKLRVVSVPTASRMSCRNNCKQRCQQQGSEEPALAAAKSVTDLEHEHSIRDDNLANESRNAQLSGMNSKRAIAGEARIKSENTKQISGKIDSLFLERRLASNWKDTYDMTSSNDCDDYSGRTQARKRATTTTLDGSHDQRLINVCRQNEIQLMRNHFWPPYEPCHCSRIPSVTCDKTVGNHSVPSLCTLLCSSFASSTNANTRSDNKDNLQRREDDLKIPIDYDRRSRLPLANCGTRGEIHYCRCGELSEGYKRCLMLLNRPDDGESSVISDPLGPLAPSMHGPGKLVTIHRGFEQELAKLDDNGRGDKNKSCHDIFDVSFDDDREMCQETGATNSDKDRVQTVEKSQLKHESSTQYGCESSCGIKTDTGQSLNRKLTPIDVVARELNRYQTGCICADAHGETLLVTMEKQTLEKEPHRLVNASVHASDLINFRNDLNFGDYNHSLDDNRGRDTDKGNSNSPKKSDSSRLSESTKQRASECRQETDSTVDHKDDSSYAESIDKPIGAMVDPTGVEITRSASSSKADPCNKQENFDSLQQQRLETNDNNGLISNNDFNEVPCEMIDSREGDRLRRSQSESLLGARKLLTAQESRGTFMQNNFHNLSAGDSVLLAVIVIDIINETVLITPDINEQVEIDLSILNANNDADILGARDLSTNILQSQSSTSWINRRLPEPLLFHVESTRDYNHLLTSNRSIDILRSEFGLGRQLRPPDSRRFVKQSNCRMIAGRPGGVLLRLQFTLHYACDFSRDCHKIYVRYKVLARRSSKWKIQPRLETRDIEHKASGTNTRTELVTRTPYLYGFAPIFLSDDRVDDKAKLEHMTLTERKLLPDSSALITDDVRDTANKTVDRGGGNHEIVGPLATSGSTSGCFSTADGDDDDGFLILLEGSTTTCMSNSRGHFNFSCAEQLTLELSKESSSADCARTNERHDDRNFSVHGDHRVPHLNDDGTATARRDKKISNEIDEQRIPKSSNENQMQTPEETLNTPMADKMLVSQSAECSQITTEALSATMTNEADSFARSDHGGEPDESEDLLTRSIIANAGKIDQNLRNCTKCMSNICSCESSNLLDDEQRQNNEKPKTDRYQSNLFQQSDVACEILLVFRIYSTDFYHDKLQGWSSVRVPIDLSDELSRVSKKDYPNKRFEQQTKYQQSFGSRDKYKCTHECRRYNLPVMRPALCAPMDRLRYYLIGKMPKWTPSVESFVHSNNRYMLQTQQCGKLVVDLGSSRHSR